jgi:hypothetical protein
MSPQVILPFAGLAVLIILIPFAVYQRRLASANPRTTPVGLASNETIPRSRGPAFAVAHTPSGRNSLTTGQVALGVFLGMWMFVISSAILTFGLIVAVGNSVGGR